MAQSKNVKLDISATTNHNAAAQDGLKVKPMRRRGFWDRIKAAWRAFQGKPKTSISIGVEVKQCRKCDREQIREMKESLTPIARRCYSDNNDGAHGDPRPTGCEYGFRKRLRCKRCPHWSMIRYSRSISEVYAEALVAGIEAGSKDADATKAMKDVIERYLKEAAQ